MLTKDERVKILDFGLAKLAPMGSTGAEGSHRAAETGTFPGVVLGTVGYMSPEQAKGVAVDYRSDQFSLGSVIYEMATGKRAFHGKSAVDTMAAIINQEPEPIEKIDTQVPGPAALDRRAMSRQGAGAPLCLDAGSGAGAEIRPRSPVGDVRRVGSLRGRAGLASRVCSAAAAVARRCRRDRLRLEAHAGERPIPDFQRLTFRRGVVSSARFAPDGRTIVYSAAFEGSPPGLFSTRTDGRDSNRLDLPEAELLSVSSLGELALSLGGTLARVPLTGGAPREMIEGVRDADWSPDGQSLAVIRDVEGKRRLEYPIGKVLYEPRERIFDMYSRAGFTGREAHRFPGRARRRVGCFGRDGGPRRRAPRSLAPLQAVDAPGLVAGRQGTLVDRQRARIATALLRRHVEGRGAPSCCGCPPGSSLQDVARDGRVLVTLAPQQTRIWARSPGDARGTRPLLARGFLRQGPDTRREDAALR